jgi:SAM-dependent methyltransferase
MSPAVSRFREKLRGALADQTFVKLTLSEPQGAEPGLRNVYARCVEVQGERRVSLVWRHARQDVTKNLPIGEAIETLGAMLGPTFSRAHLFTSTGDWRLDTVRDTLKASRPVFAVVPETEHDRRKVKALGPAPFLAALGVTDAAGVARPGMTDKLRQIERFTELLGHLLADSPLRDRRELRVLDLGAGKGYLTFATHAFFRARGVAAEVTGVEMREDLVALTNRVATELKHDGLRFVRGVIRDFTPAAPPDVLIALHACDTATDDAVHLGITSGAQLILAAPCCHKELRAQLSAPPLLRDVLRHGILAEREAEIVTDGLRALLLEIHGYRASVFEFISPEHTSKNLMLAAHRRTQPLDPTPLRERLRALMDFYGIREQQLARRLGECPAGGPPAPAPLHRRAAGGTPQ